MCVFLSSVTSWLIGADEPRATVWIAQTMRRLRDRQLLDIAQKRQERVRYEAFSVPSKWSSLLSVLIQRSLITQRLVGATLEVWKSRVIVRKSLERDASDFFDRKAVACVTLSSLTDSFMRLTPNAQC